MEQQANGSLRLVMTGIAIGYELDARRMPRSANRGQSAPRQPATARKRKRRRHRGGDEHRQQTGKILNEAIELLNMENYAAASQKIDTLQLDKLSPYERGKVEQILFNIAYSQDKYEEARGHFKRPSTPAA